jgi:hypothetical protein
MLLLGLFFMVLLGNNNKYIIKAFPKIEFGIKTLYLQDIMQTTHKDRVVLVPLC